MRYRQHVPVRAKCRPRRVLKGSQDAHAQSWLRPGRVGIKEPFGVCACSHHYVDVVDLLRSSHSLLFIPPMRHNDCVRRRHDGALCCEQQWSRGVMGLRQVTPHEPFRSPHDRRCGSGWQCDCAVLALQGTARDIFPNIGTPDHLRGEPRRPGSPPRWRGILTLLLRVSLASYHRNRA